MLPPANIVVRIVNTCGLLTFPLVFPGVPGWLIYVAPASLRNLRHLWIGLVMMWR